MTDFPGKVMELKSSSSSTARDTLHFKSVKELDRSLIQKMARVTGLVIASDVVCLAIYLALK